MDDECYRVEVVKACDSGQVCYDARYWVRKDVTLQLTYPQECQQNPKPESMEVWVKHKHVWVHQNNPDVAPWSGH